MARNTSLKATGPSRVRFIMLDAELNEGDLGQITQAIQNALRPVAQPLQTPRALVQRMASGSVETNEPPMAENEPEEQVVEKQEEPVQARPVSARTLRTPKVLELDLTSEPSFAAYAQAKNPPSDQLRFLMVAAWFKQHRSLESITADHVYTCYRAVSWPSSIADFSSPLRALKHQQLMVQTSKGNYAINHLGLAKVDKLGT